MDLTDSLARPHHGPMTTTAETLLEREIRATRNHLANSLGTRRNHPTFGVTKAGLTAILNRLEGLIIAHRIVTGEAPPNPSALVGPYALSTLDIDLADFARQIKES